MKKSVLGRKYCWKPDSPDHRDTYWTATAPVMLPPVVDLRPLCPPVYDQGQLGSCTANAIAGAHQFEQMKQADAAPFIPSRLFIYWNERDMEGDTGQDNGAQIRDGIKSVATKGVCPETEWPYDPSQFAVRPPQSCYDDAVPNVILFYARVQRFISEMKQCLAQGFPFVCGISVYESFESADVAKTGVVPMPQLFEQKLGGHAVMCVGYDEGQARFTMRNSWGTGWGQAGYFTIPYSYLCNPGLASDFWKIVMVKAEDSGNTQQRSETK